MNNDDADLIRYVDWIEVDELPTDADVTFPLDTPFDQAAVKLLNVSDPDRLYLAVWHNGCPPRVQVSTSIQQAGEPLLIIEISNSRRRSCTDMLKPGVVDVHMEEPIDPSSIFLTTEDRRTR